MIFLALTALVFLQCFATSKSVVAMEHNMLGSRDLDRDSTLKNNGEIYQAKKRKKVVLGNAKEEEDY